jgi:hypothetical protein
VVKIKVRELRVGDKIRLLPTTDLLTVGKIEKFGVVNGVSVFWFETETAMFREYGSRQLCLYEREGKQV